MIDIKKIIEEKFWDKFTIMNNVFIKTDKKTFLQMYDILCEEYYPIKGQSRKNLISHYTDHPIVYFSLHNGEIIYLHTDNIFSIIKNNIIDSREIIEIYRSEKIKRIKEKIYA